ncbi:TetR/AcrR family transcriptional regulator [Streptomyces sp. NPDC101194]|uniref:TetR/AcrR family transcriptional regulator n=1 Tax=Streptomyces sp. NPDC101194 TaxID=3366127 RepID=UPI00382E9B37
MADERPGGAERKAALVIAAYEQIAAKGLGGLRLREVANAVGIDHSTIHHHFPTKRDLVCAVAGHATRQFWTATPATGTPREKLHAHLTTLGRMIAEHPDLHVVLREIDLAALRDPELAEAITANERGWQASLTSVFADGAAERAWPDGVDPVIAARLVIASVKGASLGSEHAAAVLAQLDTLLGGGSPT